MIRRRAIFLSSFGFLGALSIYALLQILDFPSLSSAPPGQLFYRFSKWLGLVAGALLCLQILVGNMNVLRMRKTWPWGRKGHVILAAISSAFLLGHISSYFTAVFFRTGQIPFELLIPSFDTGFYQRHLFFGALGFVFIGLSGLSGWMVVRNFNSGRYLHFSTYLSLFFVLLHCLNIGSESRSGYSLSLLILTFITIALFWYMRRKSFLFQSNS